MMRRPNGLSPLVVATAEEFLRSRTGLVFRDVRRSALEGGLVLAMRRADLSDPVAYLARLDAEPALLDDLIREVTVGETYFFREPAQFAVIRDEIVPSLLAGRARDHRLHVWSAGCATGEEPYSLAILVRELGHAAVTRIVGTDLSRSALDTARRGIYSRWSFRGMPESVRRTYFEKSGGRFALMPAVRNAVDFHYLNLAEEAHQPAGERVRPADLILCRNVLIYLDADTVIQVAHRLIDSLSDEGWLLLGASDPLLGDLVRCEVVITDAGLAYRRPGRGSVATAGVVMWTSALESPPIPAAADSDPQPVVPEPLSAAGTAAASGEVELDKAPDDLAARIAQVREFANRGDSIGAERACIAALDQYRASVELTVLYAVLLSAAGRHADAVTAARRALYLDGATIMAHLVLGESRSRLGDADGAHRAFRNAERLLDVLPADVIVPASDGERAERLAELVRMRRQVHDGVA